MAKASLTVSIPEALKKRLDSTAASLGLSVSATVESILESQLDTMVVFHRTLAALERSEAEREVLAAQIRVIGDFIADHIGTERAGR